MKIKTAVLFGLVVTFLTSYLSWSIKYSDYPPPVYVFIIFSFGIITGMAWMMIGLGWVLDAIKK